MHNLSSLTCLRTVAKVLNKLCSDGAITLTAYKQSETHKRTRIIMLYKGKYVKSDIISAELTWSNDFYKRVESALPTVIDAEQFDAIHPVMSNIEQLEFRLLITQAALDIHKEQ